MSCFFELDPKDCQAADPCQRCALWLRELKEAQRLRDYWRELATKTSDEVIRLESENSALLTELAALKHERDIWEKPLIDQLRAQIRKMTNIHREEGNDAVREIEQLREALEAFVSDFECDFVLRGEIVDDPDSRWCVLTSLYTKAKDALTGGSAP